MSEVFRVVFGVSIGEELVVRVEKALEVRLGVFVRALLVDDGETARDRPQRAAALDQVAAVAAAAEGAQIDAELVVALEPAERRPVPAVLEQPPVCGVEGWRACCLLRPPGSASTSSRRSSGRSLSARRRALKLALRDFSLLALVTSKPALTEPSQRLMICVVELQRVEPDDLPHVDRLLLAFALAGATCPEPPIWPACHRCGCRLPARRRRAPCW